MAQKVGLEGCGPVEGFDGGLWSYKGRNYVVFITHGSLMKNPTSGKWIPVVGYSAQQPENDEPHQYFRERGDFLKKFTKVEEPQEAA